jgi:Domain of unknown function (DUF4112)
MQSTGSDNDDRLQRYLLVANALDQLFRVPGTRLRFGLDAIIGLVPGAGDIATALIGAYGLVIAQQLGAPGSIQLRMLVNLLIDAAVGAIPILGDLFDFAFKANVRNASLLTGWLARPHETRRSSVLVLLAMLIVLITSVCAVVWVIFAAVRGLLHLLAGAAG